MSTYPTLSLDDESAAYRKLKDTYALTAKQRTQLDAAPMLGEILRHAHRDELLEAGGLLVDQGVIAMGQFVLRAEAL
jgi:hypothetical protein